MADNVNIIVQDTINDIVVNAAVIVETIDINVQAAVDVVEIIANPNNYVVNINRIIGEQVQSDWTQNDNQAPDYIKNKPTLAAVATSGDYDDLINTPTIPTATSDLTNDGEDGINPFITAADVTAQVNSDWNATTGVAEILNKPTIPTNTSDLTNDGEDGVNPFITLADVPVPTNGLPAGGTAGQILTKVDATDYNATWQENFADWTSQVKHIVKNNGLSGTITKGTAVYVTGSNGTNMLVGRASNASEATSSKTMGLMQSDITTTGGNQTGFVITEGLLEGLNTAAATAGDPVWLGVNGALIYGLVNKPYAPAHLVFIGIVTKVSAGNGEIFVKVQNGFELKEIHDVDIITTTPINGHLLGFDGTLWVNKTIATWLGFTPVTNARTISTTAPLSGGGDLSANRTLSITQAATAADGYLSSTDWNTFNGKQAALISGTNIKSINGTSILGSGDLVISGSNIYNSDGSLTAARTLTLNAFALTFAGTTSTRFFANGNIGINQTTDAGYKLDVNGTARVSGTTTITPAALTGTAATSALDIAQTWNTTGTPTAIKLNITDTASNGNSRLLDIQVGGVSKLIFGKNGKLFFGAFNSTSNIQGNDTSKGLIFSTSLNSVVGNGFEFANLQGSITNLSSTSNGLLIQAAGSLGFSPTSGTGLYNSIHINDRINQTGGANGITRGLYINPTLTAVADFRAIEVANGITILGASTTAKASLRIPSGTAPTTPTNGDIWFDGTDLKMRIGGVTKTFTLL